MGYEEFGLDPGSKNTISFDLEFESLVRNIAIATTNYGEYATSDFKVKLTDIYEDSFDCPTVQNDVDDSGMIAVLCDSKPAKKVEIELNNESEDRMVVKIAKIGVFGSGEVTDTDRVNYVSPEELAKIE